MQEYGDSMLPEDGDRILAVETITQFPGLKMVNKVYNGAKISLNETSGIPKYSFVLIGEELSVSGLPPVVWVFNKLTKAEEKKGSLKPSGVAVSNITAIQGIDGKYAFQFSADIKIMIKFPRALLKILPTNKEKAEASGGSSIAKAVEKDVKLGVKGVRDAFLKFESS